MVVFGEVYADVCPELCKAIPGDTAAKVAYLQEELHEHYPHVVITQQADVVKVHGHWQEVIDLHSVLDQWYTKFLAIEKQKHELSLQQDGTNVVNLEEDLPAAEQNSVRVGSEKQTELSEDQSVAETFEANCSLPTCLTAEQQLLQQSVNNLVSVYPVSSADTPLFTTKSTLDSVRDEGSFTMQPTESSVRRTDEILENVTNPHMAATGKSPNDSNINCDESRNEALIEKPVVQPAEVTNKLDESAVSSELNTSDTLVDLEMSDIKSFIKSWSGRMRNQEVQTDVPELLSPTYAGRRRGRKPGSPRKAKAHIPVKRETLSERARSRPDRFGMQDEPVTPRKKRGRPKKNYSDILPEEMIPLPVNASENVINMEDDTFDQQTPAFDDIELILDEKPKENTSHAPNEIVNTMVTTEPNSVVVLPTAPSDDSPWEPVQRSAKAKAILKVGVMAKEEEGLEIQEEKRGRKPKEGPCVSREQIEAYLPLEDIFETGPFRCKLCPHASKKRAALKQHYLRCHLERKFQCRTCGKRYSLLKELATHKLTHNRRHQCQLCDKKFATQYLLEGHVERRHLNPKKRPAADGEEGAANRQCTQCEFVAKSRKSLQDHMDRIHGEKIHPCPICNKMFALVKDLNQHIKFHSERYQCEECGKSLKSKLALKLHINGIHRGIKLAQKKEYVCEDCGKICRNKTHFKEHINKEHLHVKPYHCEICPLAFFTKHALKCHGRVHSDIREFICDLCGKGFKNRSGLRVHRITHQDVAARPYMCETCHKTFTQRGALVRHERIHSGDRPYKCRLCDSSFNDYSILRRHVVGVHKINDRALCGRVDIDPNATNRGRPKMPGPVEHPDSDLLNSQKQAELLVNAEKQAELLAHAALKVAQDIAQPAQLETIDNSSTTNIQHVAQHPASFQAFVENHQRNTPLGQRMVHQQGMKPEELGISSSQVPTPAHTPGPKDLSLSHVSAAHNPSQMQPIELITIGSGLDVSGNQVVTTPLVHQQGTPHSSINVSNMVPISVVSDMVQNVLYEHHHSLEGGYTIGMPVFPTPTTVANMHMMQTLPPGQHTLTHLQSSNSTPNNNNSNRERHGHM